MDNNSIISKIQKLFAQAQNTPYEAEANTAMLMAQKLMVKYKISMSEVNQQRPDKNNNTVIIYNLTPEGKQLWWKKSLATIIGTNFKCACFNKLHGKGVTNLVFIGYQEDIDIAKSVYSYAESIITYHTKNYIETRKENNLYHKGDKNTYIMGYLAGIQRKFKEQVEANGWGLVLVQDDAIQKVLNNFNLKKGQAPGAKMTKDKRVYDAGFEKGKNFIKPEGMLN